MTMAFRTIEITSDEVREVLADGSNGICAGCCRWQHGCEPDVRGRTCEACEKPFVFGVEELLLAGGFRVVSELGEVRS